VLNRARVNLYNSRAKRSLGGDRLINYRAINPLAAACETVFSKYSRSTDRVPQFWLYSSYCTYCCIRDKSVL